MKFGIFYEHQLPRPWTEASEQQLFQDALDQVELADRLGIDYAWEVEHHFLEEYSHSSAPEVFLAAASQRTKRIRLGHGIVLMPPGYNHPARVAERIATLDLVSNGRVEWGTGESASRTELEGFGVDPAERRAMWREAVEQVANMMVMDPYPGFEGKYFSMPVRNVVPKPVQKPHPPLWVACSNRETIHLAAQLGIGALTFAFIDPARGEALGRRLLRDVQARVRADRPRRQPEHRDGDGLLVPRGRRTRRGAAASTASASSSSRSATLRVRHAQARAAPTSGRSTWRCAIEIGTEVLGAAAPAASARRSSSREPLRDVPGVGRRPDGVHPAGRATTATSTSASRSSCSPREVMPEFKAQEARARGAQGARSSRRTSRRRSRASRSMAPLADDEIPSLPGVRPHRGRGRPLEDAGGEPPARAGDEELREIAERS